MNENAEGVTMTIEGMKNYTKTVMKYTTCAFQRVMDQEFGEHLDDTAYAVFTEFLDKKKWSKITAKVIYEKNMY